MLIYKNILVPVDFAEISDSAVLQAAKHSQASNSQLMVVHVLDSTTADQAQLIRQKEQQLEALLDRLEIGYCEKLVVAGETVSSLLKVIKQHNIDLVVMGTHTGSNPPEWTQSITREVVANTECDVLVLHK